MTGRLRSKAAGVKIASGSAYHPVARNNEVLRTPDDPQATYDYMVRAWQADDAEYAGTGWPDHHPGRPGARPGSG